MNNIEGFLDRISKGYNWEVEFRHESWQTEEALELLKQYNIASVQRKSDL